VNGIKHKKTMDTSRKISYIESEKEALNEELGLSRPSIAEVNLRRSCEVLSAQLAKQGIDLKNDPVERCINYID
jgi:hypothetical protein